MEDRFLTLDQVQAVSVDLETHGFDHTLALHRVDPAWRHGYRASRPELDGWMWSVRLGDLLVPMERLRVLIALCDRHSLTFWLGGSSTNSHDEGSGVELYLKITPQEAQ